MELNWFGKILWFFVRKYRFYRTKFKYLMVPHKMVPKGIAGFNDLVYPQFLKWFIKKDD